MINFTGALLEIQG